MPPYPDPIVEQLAQRRFHFESLFEEQASVIREKPSELQEVYDRNLHGYATKPGDQWIPADAVQMEKNIKTMEAICAETPSSIDDRMRIALAENGLLMYLVRFDMNALPLSTQNQITKRTVELHRELLPLPEHHQATLKEPLERPSPLPPTRRITSREMKLFKNQPLKIVGMSFIQKEDEDSREWVFYNVAEIGQSKTEVWYQIHFEGCSDYIQIDQKEMLYMLKSSHMFVV